MNTGFAIAAGSMIGLGLGFLMNNMLPYLMIGTGCGFLLALSLNRKNQKDNNDEN